jgi:hypothetical protein
MALVFSHLQIGDNINIISIVRYLRTKYNEVHLVVLDKYESNIKSFYSDDISIKFIIVNTMNNWWQTKDYFNQIPFNNFNPNDIYIGGELRKHFNKYSHSWDNTPFNIYEDMNIPYNIFWNNFYIPITNKTTHLYNMLNGMKYIFMHGSTSLGKAFDINYVLNKINKSKDDIIVIDPNINQYNIGDKYYELANQFINHTVHDYMELMINADQLFLSNSCFFCLAIHLKINTNNCYVYFREGTNKNKSYDYIWNNMFGYNINSGFKKFITVL